MARPVVYDKSADQLRQEIDSYFDYLQNNPTVRGGPSDFLASVGLTMELATELTKTPLEPYKEHSKLLKMAAIRMRAHLETSPAWANGNGSKSIYLTKQTLWDGKAYSDKQEIESNNTHTIRVDFGVPNAKGKKSKADADAFD